MKDSNGKGGGYDVRWNDDDDYGGHDGRGANALGVTIIAISTKMMTINKVISMI